MDKAYIGGFMIGISLSYLFGSFLFMSLLQVDFKTQILFGMLPGVIVAIIGVGFIIIESRQREKQKVGDVA